MRDPPQAQVPCWPQTACPPSPTCFLPHQPQTLKPNLVSFSSPRLGLLHTGEGDEKSRTGAAIPRNRTLGLFPSSNIPPFQTWPHAPPPQVLSGTGTPRASLPVTSTLGTRLLPGTPHTPALSLCPSPLTLPGEKTHLLFISARKENAPPGGSDVGSQTGLWVTSASLLGSDFPKFYKGSQWFGFYGLPPLPPEKHHKNHFFFFF